MKGNRLLAILLIVVVLLMGVFVWLVNKLLISKKLAPYFPQSITINIDKEGNWQEVAFQPIFEELVDTGSEGYLRVSYADSTNGTTMEGRIYLAQQVPYINDANVQEIVTRKELGSKLIKGEQFGVYYLSEFPADPLQTPHCQSQEVKPVECIYAYFKQESGKAGENIFYPLAFYQTLKQ